MIVLNEHLAAHLPADAPFEAVLALDGETFRTHKHRRTFRCEIGGRAYFVKIHRHAGWGEVLKDSLRARRPIVTADPEVRAIERCRERGIPTVTPAGYGTRGRAPARLESFIITEPLEGFVHLDAFVETLSAMPRSERFRVRRRIIAELAEIARRLHESGMNHRDLYLCHFMLPPPDAAADAPLRIHVIDLHRVQIRASVPRRWIAKDLAALLFSSLDAPVTSRDLVRFLRAYWGPSWREKIGDERAFLRRIIRRTLRLYRDEHGKPPRPPAGLASF